MLDARQVIEIAPQLIASISVAFHKTKSASKPGILRADPCQAQEMIADHARDGHFHVFGNKLGGGVGFPGSLECYRIHGSDETFACSMLLSRERYESKLALSRSFILFWPMSAELS
jgi:hypothetical protein